MDERTIDQLMADMENAYKVADRAFSQNNQRVYETAMKSIYRLEAEIETRNNLQNVG